MKNPRYRKAEHVSSRRVQDELVLLDLEEGQYLVARGVGPEVWEMLVDGHTREEIVAAVAARFEQDPAVIRRDVEGFISDLEAKSLLVREQD